MKKLIVIIVLAIFSASCAKEKVILPHTDLTNYVQVDLKVWYTVHGPMKAEYYLDLGEDAVPVHPWAQVIDLWGSPKPFYPCKNIYVTKSDYLTYL